LNYTRIVTADSNSTMGRSVNQLPSACTCARLAVASACRL